MVVGGFELSRRNHPQLASELSAWPRGAPYSVRVFLRLFTSASGRLTPSPKCLPAVSSQSSVKLRDDLRSGLAIE